MRNFDLDVVRPATAPGVEVIFFRASSSPALEAVMGMEDGEFVISFALISEVEMMVATGGCIASGKAEAASRISQFIAKSTVIVVQVCCNIGYRCSRVRSAGTCATLCCITIATPLHHVCPIIKQKTRLHAWFGKRSPEAWLKSRYF